MGTAFATALDQLHTDPNLSVAGTYTPVGGSPVSVRVVIGVNDDKIDVLSGARAAGFKVDVRKSDVAAPQKNDRVTVPAGPYAGTYQLRDVMEDVEALTSHCTAEGVP